MRTEDLIAELESALRDGLVSKKDRGELSIFNYTPSAAFSRQWTPATRMARGLVLDMSKRRIVANPFPKFFNLNETDETAEDSVPWHEPFEVHEKMDGSLGVIFWHDGRWDIATRGAFESDQAVYARENLLPRYDLSQAPSSWTLMAEIIYPENRIVVDYGDRSSLVLIAARETATGVDVESGSMHSLASAMGMAHARQYLARHAAELAHEHNMEGFVLHWPRSGLRLKIKSPEYVAAHRMLGMVSPKRVLDLMESGSIDDVAAQLPSHARADFDKIRADLADKVSGTVADAKRLFEANRHVLPDSRKEFAIAISDSEPSVRALAFQIANGKPDSDLTSQAIQMLRKSL